MIRAPFYSTVNMGNLPTLYNKLNRCTIDSSWAKFTDTCTLVLPQETYLRDRLLNQVIREGDPVQVYLYYDFTDEVLEFRGFVRRVKADKVVTVECEDGMYLLKRHTPAPQSWEGTTLAEVVQAIVPEGVTYGGGPTVELPTFRVEHATAAEILTVLRKDYLVDFYFRNGVLYGSGQYSNDTAQTYPVQWEEDVVATTLDFAEPNDKPLLVKVIATQPSGGQLVATAGEEGGIVETTTVSGMSQATAQQLADDILKRERVVGYKGTLTIPGYPSLRHGDSVEVRDPAMPERAGTYYIDAVRKRFGTDGYWQTLTLGPKHTDA